MNARNVSDIGTARAKRGATLPGFENIHRYWESRHGVYAARIQPGEYYVCKSDEVIATVLGSCVSACIRDPETGVGGMNHFMLPEGSEASLNDKECITNATRYGSFAMEHMINDIVRHGGRRESLEIKLTGGGRVLPTVTDVGKRNIEFVEQYLHMESLKISVSDLGGTAPRKVYYFPSTGRLLVKKIPVTKKEEVIKEEQKYQRSLASKPVAGEIDLF